MKSPASLLATALLALTLPASAVIIGVEQFDYPDGVIGTRNGGTFWNYKNTVPTGYSGAASTWDAVFGAPQVTGGRLVTSGDGAVKREYRGANETEGAVNGVNDAKKVFYRVSVTTGPSVTPADYFGISSNAFNTERLYFGKRGGSTTFGVEEVGIGGTNGSVTIQPNTTYTLVAVVDFANDFIRLFVNPDLNGPEPGAATAAATRAYTGTNSSTAVRFAAGTAVTWDDLFIATTWDDLRTVVTTAVDEDNLSNSSVSLREAVKYSPAGSLITFAPGLSGQTITLTHPDGQIPIDRVLTIDASALPSGMTVSGNNNTRHFYVSSGKFLTLRGLTLTGGSVAGDGGSVYILGTLNADRCTFSGNQSSGAVGAVANFGTFTAERSTFTGNTAPFVGAIYGAEDTQTTLRQCTISGNTATLSEAGGVHSRGSTVVENSIIAGNRAVIYPDVQFVSGTLTRSGTNLIGANESVASQFPPGTPNANGDFVGTAAAPVDPKLTPLGYFGGPVQTLHPLIGSPAIDSAGTTNPGGTDARGFPRFVDGNANTVSQLDIGAVEAGPVLRVSETTDAETNTTLRTVLAAASVLGGPGVRITFNPAFFPATITLNGTELVPPGKAIFMDASNIPGGVTISGNAASPSRIFNIPATATVAMHSLQLRDGSAASGDIFSPGSPGGGIFNEGTLTLQHSSLCNNRAGSGSNGGNGGAIANSGTLSITACTLDENFAGTGSFVSNSGAHGGGIYNTGSVRITTSTLTGNRAGNIGSSLGASGHGGGLYNGGNSHLSRCTVAGNHAGSGGNVGGSGGGVYHASGTLSVSSSTLTENSRGVGSFLFDPPGTGGGIYAAAGNFSLTTSIVTSNLSDNLAGITPSGSLNLTTGDALLAPLADYGGPTQTMALRPGSPARDAATGSTASTDQRGFPTVGTPDIGAYEAGTFFSNNFSAWAAINLAETLPNTGPAENVTLAADFDGDGASNEFEWIAGTTLTDPASVLRATIARSGNNMTISFPSLSFKSYTLWQSDTLTGPWTNTGLTAINGDGSVKTFTTPAPVNGVPRRFYRVQLFRGQ